MGLRVRAWWLGAPPHVHWVCVSRRSFKEVTQLHLPEEGC